MTKQLKITGCAELCLSVRYWHFYRSITCEPRAGRFHSAC